MSEVADITQRKAFTGALQLGWDSTSLSAAKRCPRYYQLSIIEGWRPKHASEHLTFGTLLHSALEFLDKRRVATATHVLGDKDLIDALRFVMNAAGKRDPDGTWHPWVSTHDSKDLESLIRTVVWYFDQYSEDAFHNFTLANGQAAVELSFRFDLFPNSSFNGEKLLYCGHLDKLGTYGGSKKILDRKTTGSALSPYFYAQFSPNVQMPGYTLAGKVCFDEDLSGIVIDAMQIGAAFTRFGRHEVTYTPGQLEEWLEGTQDTVLLFLNKYAAQGKWPMNETACGMYGGCPFQGICSLDPSQRARFLANDFVVQAWDPLTPRGIE